MWPRPGSRSRPRPGAESPALFGPFRPTLRPQPRPRWFQRQCSGPATGNRPLTAPRYTGGLTIDLSANTDSDGDTLASFEDVIGTFSADTLTGDDGSNVMFGSEGDDVLNGLDGADTLVGDGGFDASDGGLGTDRCQAEDQQNCEFGWPARGLSRADRSFGGVYQWRRTMARFGFNRLGRGSP